MEIHSSILAWEIPWTEEPGRIHIYVCIHLYCLFFLFLSVIVYYKRLNIVPCGVGFINKSICIVFYFLIYF